MSRGDEGASKLSAIVGEHGFLDELERTVEFAAVILDELIQRGVQQLLRTLTANGCEQLRSLDVLCIQPCSLCGVHRETTYHCNVVTQ